MKKFTAWFFGVLLITSTSIFGAAPLVHVAIAEKWLEAFEDYDEGQKRAFMLGTLFPDIRYLGGLPRESTHVHGLKIEEIKAIQDPFLKGMRVHGFVDEARYEYLKKHNVLELFLGIPGDVNLSLKLLEDEVLYGMRSEGASLYLCQYLEHIETQELAFTIPFEIVAHWHENHSDYFKLRPSELYSKLLKNKQGFGALRWISIQNAYEVMQQFREDRRIKEYVSSMLAEFDLIFKEASGVRR